MEVLHGDIRITLSDQEAIRGMERTRASVKRGLAQIGREKAVISIEGDIKNLKRSLKEAEGLVKSHQDRIDTLTKQREGTVGSTKGAFTRQINQATKLRDAAQQTLKVESKRLDILQEQVANQKQSNKEAALSTKEAEHRRKEEEATVDAIKNQAKATQTHGAMRSRAEREMRREFEMRDKREREFNLMRQRAEREMGDAFSAREKDERAFNLLRLRAEREMSQAFATRSKNEREMQGIRHRALLDDRAREGEVAKLQTAYNNANQALQRLQQTGRAKRATSPEEKIKFDFKTAELYSEMEVIRAKLAMMNRDPIDIKLDVKRSTAIQKLMGIGDTGMRLGPFTGTLKSFSIAAGVLGPILTGLLGTVTALAGAIGTGLTGAVGIAGAGLGAFGLTLGGVGLLTASLFRDFKNLNTLQDAYHKQVLKTGAGSDKAKTKLDEFNHALGAVTPTTRAAFLALDTLQGRWRALRQQAKPDFFNTLGEAITTVNADFGVFSRQTLQAFHAVAGGMQSWFKGLRSGAAQQTIFTVMSNTTAAIGPLMSALGHLGAAFGRTMASFSRHFAPLMSDFDTWTGHIDKATQNTGNLNTGVDHLVDSFRDVLGVSTAFGRVIIELSRAAMGPGGNMMDDMAGGLNDIADSIAANPKPISDFFRDSIGTVKELYQALVPLVKLFLEFSTIMRPATNAILSIIGPVAQLTQDITSLGAVRTGIEIWATSWLFRKGTAVIVGGLAAAVNGLAAALGRVSVAAAGAKLGALATMAGRGSGALNRRAGGIVGGGGAVLGGGGAAVRGGPMGTQQVRGGPTVISRMTQRPLEAPPAAARTAGGILGAGRLATGVGAVTKGLGALTTGLLGVSPPVAALGIAAFGAYKGISALKGAADKRAREENAARKTFGKDVIPNKPSPERPDGKRPAMIGLPGQGGGIRDKVAWEDNRDKVVAANKALMDLNKSMIQSGQIQRELVGLGSQLQNSHLMVEQAEKTYADAVKHSGKNSLEARTALQSLRDARVQESQATEAWAKRSNDAGNVVYAAVHRAQDAFNDAKGSTAESFMAKRLEDAKNRAAAFEINLRRAKKGVDIFTGEGSNKIGEFVRQFGKIPGVKRTIVRVDTQEAALKLADTISTLEKLGQRKTITRILANGDNPRQQLKDLNAALDRWERRHPVADLRADKRDAEKKLSDANNALSHYGSRKPEALLKARDDAKAKIKALERQLAALDGKKATITAKVKFELDANAAMGSDRATGDGWGVPNIRQNVKSLAKNNSAKLSNMFLDAGGLGNATAMGSGLNTFNGLAQRFGLTVGSGLRPGAITDAGNLSYHSMGRARDFPGPPGQMLKFAKFMAATFGHRLKELIHTPLGFSIKNGHKVPPYSQKDHYDHVHVAMAKGGEVKPGRYNKPTVLFAEESGHPEYFISTNPRDRKRSRALVQQAAAEVGVKEHSPAFYAMPHKKGGKRGGGPFGSNTARAKRIWDYFIAQGFTKRQAAGFIGNFMQESKLNPGAVEKGGPGRGLGQWGGDRFKALQRFAAGRHTKWNNLETQLAFTMHELHGPESRAMGAIKKARTVKEAVKAVGQKYERFGVAGNRYGPAFTAFHSFKSLPSGTSGPGLGSIGIDTTKAQIPVHGARGSYANTIAFQQAQVEAAQGTEGIYSDDIRAIFGYDKKVSPRDKRFKTGRNVPRNVHSGTGRLTNPKGKGKGRVRTTPDKRRPQTEHIDGLVDTLGKQNRRLQKRASVVQKKLAGKLTPEKRAALLQEQESITGTLTGNRSTIRDLRQQGAEARFERDQRMHGGGSLVDIEARKANAGKTVDLSDDMAAAKAEQGYYAAKAKWAADRGDTAGATEATNAYNSATEQIKSITDQIRSDKFAAEEGWLGWVEGQVKQTGTLNDDLQVMNDSLAYWQSRVGEANSRGDAQGAYAAAANVQGITENLKNLKEDMKRLPLERDRALAALTDDTADDTKATIALRDYWKNRLDQAKKDNDLAGQIEAATNLKGLNDEIKAAEENVATQMVAFSQARQDLFKTFGSNFIPTAPAALAPSAAAAASSRVGSTVVNLTVNGATLAQDAHTWSQNVAWELQAAV